MYLIGYERICYKNVKLVFVKQCPDFERFIFRHTLALKALTGIDLKCTLYSISDSKVMAWQCSFQSIR